MCTCNHQLQPHDPISGVCPKPCLKADFPGDTCEFWMTHYGLEPCANCEEMLRAQG